MRNPVLKGHQSSVTIVLARQEEVSCEKHIYVKEVTNEWETNQNPFPYNKEVPATDRELHK